MLQNTQEARNLIYLPPQAPPHSTGPFCAIHLGLATGVYLKSSWTDGVLNLVKPKHIKDYGIDPFWQNFPSWKQAAWFCSQGVVLQAAALQQPVPMPIRRVQPVEILSAFYPRGSTIVIEDEDIIVPYTKEPVVPTVSLIRRRDLDVEDGMNQPLPPHPASPAAQQPPSSSFASKVNRPIKEEEMSPPPPTLIDPESRPSTPVGNRAGKAKARGAVIYRPWDYQSDAQLAKLDMLAPPQRPVKGRQLEQPLVPPPHSQPLPNRLVFPPAGLNAQASSSQPVSGTCSNDGDPLRVFYEAHKRLHSIRANRHTDAALEAQINECLIVLLLETTDLSPEGAEKVRIAVSRE